MVVIAQRPLKGEYGLVSSGQQFSVRDEVAVDLLKRGLVKTYEAPTHTPAETKVIAPAEQPQRRRNKKSAAS
jgi:hypothetical protein